MEPIAALILAASVALGALILAVRRGLEAGFEEVAKLGARNANWGTEITHELQKVRGTERQELRYKAYAGLWKEQRPLAIYHANLPSEQANQPPEPPIFGPTQAAALLNAQSSWYFDEAGGLMLTVTARKFYFTWQDLLEAVARKRDWRADRPNGKARDVFQGVLEANGRGEGSTRLAGAIGALEYLKMIEGQIDKWPTDAAEHASNWKDDIATLPGAWERLNSEQKFAVLQQVSSTLRTVMTIDIESRVR